MQGERSGKGRNRNNTVTHTQISIRIPDTLLKSVDAFARADRRSRNNAVEHLLWQAVKEKR
jgi:metal-responsive CopG/Arc/MetJ family transcriptional regulator